mmetsp:Transcript_1913/g.2675  ORF Transcript_1913/g.2675 Transcript_1913/m.2675 type:complete len:102 (+) Transcript_1913:49-354(+)|eukprot:CAMPEP_0118693624 /NCGR_PEP_ID=MMETSP0800-20121206/12020_1 /TAXON_ID=210618 ORGANISM="Striatella unipunctata, Strain CCMP2910" /NCGR_SAMPLE_ID=MMETSP0800 /ASSEMBLY_ACC=CAM_ASM_000638 /LENGTH=101 /DNA_ID=CAMNT_0006591897 /DNA_START=49 /DNA_END=354 /DNA_ORIENTATION=+
MTAVRGAIVRSRVLLGPGRSDVSPHLVKWWGKQKQVDGMITRHLSPYEQQPVMPWLKTFPQRAYDKFVNSFMYWGTTAGIVVGTVIWADAVDAAESFSHRF